MDETKILRPKPVSTRQLTWDSQHQEYVGEISSTYGFGQVYTDACDEGLTLVSAKTGHEVVFVVEHEERDDLENEILFWVLRPATKIDRHVRVRLFND